MGLRRSGALASFTSTGLSGECFAEGRHVEVRQRSIVIIDVCRNNYFCIPERMHGARQLRDQFAGFHYWNLSGSGLKKALVQEFDDSSIESAPGV